MKLYLTGYFAGVEVTYSNHREYFIGTKKTTVRKMAKIAGFADWKKFRREVIAPAMKLATAKAAKAERREQMKKTVIRGIASVIYDSGFALAFIAFMTVYFVAVMVAGIALHDFVNAIAGNAVLVAGVVGIVPATVKVFAGKEWELQEKAYKVMQANK